MKLARSFTPLGFSTRALAQIGACVVLVLLVVVSAAATVSAPQTTLATSTTARQITPSRTPSPTATSALAPRTSTPRVVAPRSSVPGQPPVDAHTIALYRFDTPNTVAIDATGRYTGTLRGNTTILDSGLYAGVLRVEGNGSYVRTGHLGNLPQGTIELFVDFREACQQGFDFTLFAAGDEFGGGSVLVIGQFPDRFLGFGIYSGGKWHWADSGINACRYLVGTSGPLWPYETWRFHHVAVTWGPRGMEIWVNGVLHGVGTDYPNAYVRPYKYMCNPQMQMGDMDDEPPNPLYPACMTPVMAPTMPAYPPGAYTGGLPNYSTMLIGCGSGGSCFKGRIDEVRISNVQRTFHWSVVPTVTPTPTWTPIAPSGEYPVDQYTQALLHLNFVNGNSVLDEVSQTHKYFFGFASLVSNGRFNTALSLESARIDLDDLGGLFQGTVEAWINFDGTESSGQTIFAVPVSPLANSMLLFLGTTTWSPTLRFGIYHYDSETMHWVDSGVRPTLLAKCWHHIAGTWGPRGLEIWIDGTLRQANRGFTGGLAWSNPYWRLGCDNDGNCMKGIVDEVRVSSIQRIFVVPPYVSRVNQPFARRGDWVVFLPLILAAPTSTASGCPFGP